MCEDFAESDDEFVGFSVDSEYPEELHLFLLSVHGGFLQSGVESTGLGIDDEGDDLGIEEIVLVVCVIIWTARMTRSWSCIRSFTSRLLSL